MMSNWTKAGYGVGLLIVISGSVRYFIIYPDYSQALTFIYAGLSIMGISWIYNTLLTIKNQLQAVEEYLADKVK